MNTEVYYLEEKNLHDVARAVSSRLRKGDICIIPTDTVYGIVAIDDFQDAIRRIFEIKKRPPERRLIRLIGSLDAVCNYTEQKVPVALSKYWPGPLTIVFRDRVGGTVALRCPDDPFLRLIFREIDPEVLVAPSANISGEEIITECDTLIRTFEGEVPLIVCLKKVLEGRQASTIIDISEKRWKVVRQGALRIDVE